MGFFAAFFAQLHELAINAAGPLFTRHVERLDFQNDRAAARTFSASALDFQMTEYSDQRGLSVYLFVLGELVDSILEVESNVLKERSVEISLFLWSKTNLWEIYREQRCGRQSCEGFTGLYPT